ncbi:MAG: STAS-like domain-containing protein, partial [Myxococcales bacterium]
MPRRDLWPIISNLLDLYGSASSGEIARAAKLSRESVNRHLRRALARGDIVAQGAGCALRYVRSVEPAKHLRFKCDGLSEDEVWSKVATPLFTGPQVTEEAKSIARYAFTAMLSNAIAHSGSEQVAVSIESNERRVGFEIIDQGVGVFQKVQAALGLAEPTEAVLELSKGKVTTSPASHSGEGIFFVSKAASLFELDSADLGWVVDNALPDMALMSRPARVGTRVRCEIERSASQPLEHVFAEFSKDYRFAKTRTSIRLFSIGARFVSRSEAKKLARGLEKFSEVEFDFRDVRGVGQGFVDELFRVWANAHPEVKLTPVNMSPPVEFMV